jgi:hypothetical protein
MLVWIELLRMALIVCFDAYVVSLLVIFFFWKLEGPESVGSPEIVGSRETVG